MKSNFLRDTLIVVIPILIMIWIIYSINDARYQAVKEHYPNLTRLEFMIWGNHLMIPVKEK